MSRFKLNYSLQELHLLEPFTIARGTKVKVRNVFVRLQADGVAGYGEAAPNLRYNEDAGSVIRFLRTLPDGFFDAINSDEELFIRLSELKHPVQAAKSAIEMAWLDWRGKIQNTPLWKQWGLTSPVGPTTSYTIGLDDIEVMQQKVQDATDYPVYKVKLGTDRDKEIIRGIREVTDKPIRVDANEGWKTLEEAKDNISFLADHGIEFVEQPLPADRFDDMLKLKEFSPLPLGADESFMGNEPLEDIARAFDIINIKLMKTGSMIKARRITERAHTLGLQVMIGCMIESSLANTAGAILALQADYTDLDGHLLIKDDPARGLALDEEKRVVVNDKPGLGIELR